LRGHYSRLAQEPGENEDVEDESGAEEVAGPRYVRATDDD
jgi:hypothetical protein